MEEFENAVGEAALDGAGDWDAAEASVTAASGGEEDGGGAAAPSGDHTGDGEAQGTEDGGQPAEKAEADQSLTLKYMGGVRTVSRDEAVVLAQKGMDYDRVRGKLDELAKADAAYREDVDALRALAGERGMSLRDFADSARAEAEAKRGNITPEAALAGIRLRRREADVARREAALERPGAVDAAKRDRDVSEFMREYPDVELRSIPMEVWREVAAGRGLADAYRRAEVRSLRAELDGLRRRGAAAERTTGSRASAGAGRRDPIDEDWYGGG